MKNLLYKEFRLAIHPLFYLVPLLGALVLIPQWVYFVALMYFFFITVPNIFAVSKAQNDIGFSAMLPVRRQDIVKARVTSVVLLELLQIFVTAVFATINVAIYPQGNFLFDANLAFIGCVFVMFGIYNVIFFPMFYKTAYKIGVPTITALSAAILFAAAVEALLLYVPGARFLDGMAYTAAHFAVLLGGIVIFALLNTAAFKVSVKRFERIDL